MIKSCPFKVTAPRLFIWRRTPEQLVSMPTHKKIHQVQYPELAQLGDRGNYYWNPQAGKSSWRGRLSMVDLLVSTSSAHQLLFILKILFTSCTKQPTLTRRSTVLSLTPQLVFSGTWLSRVNLAPSKVVDEMSFHSLNIILRLVYNKNQGTLTEGKGSVRLTSSAG